MSTLSITLRPGARVDDAIRTLRTLEANSRTDGAPGLATARPEGHRQAYVRWATSTERQLSAFFARNEVQALFRSPRHSDICSMPAGDQIRILINAELDDKCLQFGELAGELEQARALFEKPGTYVALDTSFYIDHPQKLEDVDFRTLLPIWDAPVRIVIPILVVDELDGLKRSKDAHLRWRAGYTLAVIDRVLVDPRLPGILHNQDFSALNDPAGGSPQGEVTLQIAFDPPGHTRLPIPDDEIVDRCRACAAFAPHLKVLTYDTGQSMRARMNGLAVEKLSLPVGAPK